VGFEKGKGFTSRPTLNVLELGEHWVAWRWRAIVRPIYSIVDYSVNHGRGEIRMEPSTRQPNGFGDKQLQLPGDLDLTLRVLLTYWVTRKDGSEEPRITVKSRSLLRNFLRMLGGFISCGQMASAFTIKTTGGVPQGAGTTAGYQANIASEIPSLHIGSGTTAVTLADYALDSEEESGKSTGVSESSVGNIYTLTWTRSFLNEGASAWAINEVGLSATVDYAGAERDILLIRDVLASQVDVSVGDTFIIQYSIQVIA